MVVGQSRNFTFCFLSDKIVILLGLSRLCSAAFEQVLAFASTFCGSSNLEQVSFFEKVFSKIGLGHISIKKKLTIS